MATKQKSSQSPIVSKEDLLTLREAAELFGKTTSNISYLIQYDWINKYDEEGEANGKVKNGELPKIHSIDESLFTF
jgi:transposase